jgi:hypothetical protein
MKKIDWKLDKELWDIICGELYCEVLQKINIELHTELETQLRTKLYKQLDAELRWGLNNDLQTI